MSFGLGSKKLTLTAMQPEANLIIGGAFCGILIGSTLLIKNQKKDCKCLLGTLMLIMGTFLVVSFLTNRNFGVYLIFASTLLVPLFSNIYFQSLLGIKEKFSELYGVIIIIFVVTISHFFSANPDFFRSKILLLLSVCLGLGYFFSYRKSILKRLRCLSRKQKVENLFPWILVFMGILFSYYVALVYTIFIKEPLMVATLVQGSGSLLLLGWSVALLLMPRYLYKTTRNATVNFVNMSSDKTKPGYNTGRKVKYTLNEQIKEEYLDKILSYMESDKPFLDKNFTVYKLSQYLDLSPTYTSRVINKVYGKNFKDFVNCYRIEKACKNLLNDDMKKYTIEAIAQESGFNSRTAFYNAFKRVMNMSPGEYISRHEKNSVKGLNQHLEASNIL